MLKADKGKVMWLEIFQRFLLEQTEQEKTMTYFGLLFLFAFVGVLVLDTFSKGKFISTKGPLKKIILAVFVILFLILFFVGKIYK